MSLFGSDVSHWNDVTPTTGRSFVIAKVSEGTFADPKYSVHAGRTLSAGLHLAGYHFARRSVDIDAQARFFVQHATQAKALAVDIEVLRDRNGNIIDPPMTKAQARALIAAVKAHDSLHRMVGNYGSESGFYSDIGADFRWVANWDHSPSIPYDIHQYSSTPFDQDVARNQEALDRIFGVVTPAPHFLATVTTPTNLYNAQKRRWVYNGRNRIKVGTKLVIRGAQYLKGGVHCYPIIGPAYAGYWVPVAHVKVGAQVP